MNNRVRNLMIVFAFGLMTASQAVGGTGRTITVPNARTVPRSGLKINFAFDGCSTNGLRPVRVTIRPIAGVFPRDRDIQIDLGVGNYNRSEFVASKVLHAQQGDVVYRDYIYVPVRAASVRATIDTYEDGRRLRDLCLDRVDIGIDDSQQSSPPAILVIDFDTPEKSKPQSAVRGSDGKLPDMRRIEDDIRRLLSGRSGASDGEREAVMSIKETMRSISNTSYIDILNPADVWDEWISISGIDIALLSWSDLQRIKSELPQRWDALRAWAFAGGNLVLYGVGAEFEELAAVEQQFDLAPVDRDGDYRGWKRRSNLDKKLNAHLYTGQAEDDSPTKAGESNFVVREIGMGKIAAIGEEFPFPGKSRQWATLLNTLPSSWEQRHGVSWNSENEGFWDFVLAGLGLAPVNLFRVWIVVFVLAIGPLNYFLLKRTNRLSWMLMTVPIAALLTTLGLFAYALITDGLGVRYRVRSVTHIDQKSGMAATWARQVYYAGVTPSDGLMFPRDAVAIPILQSPSLEFATNQRRINWREGEQQLTGGYMQSRVMSQFMVIRSRQTPLGIQVENDAGKVSVTNQLGTVIKEIYVVAADGTRFGREDCYAKAGETFELVETADTIRVESRLLGFVNEYPLQVPDGIDVTAIRDMAQMNGSYYYYNNRNSVVSTRVSLLEKYVFAAARPAQTGKDKLSQVFLRPQTYVAIVDGCAEVPVGVEGVEQDSLYVVTGVWE